MRNSQQPKTTGLIRADDQQCTVEIGQNAYFSPSWTAISGDRGRRFSGSWTPFQTDRGRRFKLIVDDCGACE